MLLGNKSDLVAQRKVSSEEAAALARELSIPFLETSAKDATNVVDAFFAMAREMHTLHARRPRLEPRNRNVVCSPESSSQIQTNRSNWASYCSIL